MYATAWTQGMVFAILRLGWFWQFKHVFSLTAPSSDRRACVCMYECHVCASAFPCAREGGREGRRFVRRRVWTFDDGWMFALMFCFWIVGCVGFHLFRLDAWLFLGYFVHVGNPRYGRVKTGGQTGHECCCSCASLALCHFPRGIKTPRATSYENLHFKFCFLGLVCSGVVLSFLWVFVCGSTVSKADQHCSHGKWA
jgi:hypothetical protein